MKIIEENKPCIYLETKECGKNFEFFDYSENLLLTKKSQFEILVSRKMDEWKIEKKFHAPILQSLEVFLPMVILVIAGILFASKD